MKRHRISPDGCVPKRKTERLAAEAGQTRTKVIALGAARPSRRIFFHERDFACFNPAASFRRGRWLLLRWPHGRRRDWRRAVDRAGCVASGGTALSPLPFPRKAVMNADARH